MGCLAHRKLSVRVLSYWRWLLGSAALRHVLLCTWCHGSLDGDTVSGWGHCFLSILVWLTEMTFSGQDPPPVMPLHPGLPSCSPAAVSAADRSQVLRVPGWLPLRGRDSSQGSPKTSTVPARALKAQFPGGGGGAPSTFSGAASEYFEFH